MAKEIAIALNFTSKGEQKVVRNLQELEAELAKLQSELKTLDFGSNAFKEATTNINKLKSQIRDIDKATEGLETAQRIGAIGEAIGIVVSSFQILSGVIGLFITDQESLEAVQRAEATAIQVLNVALGVQAILTKENELNSKGLTTATLLQTAATDLWTAATTKLVAAQTALTAAFRANPIGFIIAGVAALTAAVLLLTKAFSGNNKEVKEQLELQKEINKSYGKEVGTLKIIQKTLESTTATQKQRKQAVEDLRKLFPGYLTDLEAEKVLAGDLVIQYDELSKALLKQAQVRALTAKIEQNAIELLDLQDLVKRLRETRAELAEASDISLLDFAAGLLQGGFQAGKLTGEIVGVQQALGEATKRINEITKSNKEYIDTIINLNSEIEPYFGGEEEGGKIISENAKITDRANKSLEKRLSLLNDLIERLNKNQQAELSFTTDVLEKQNEVIGSQNDLLNQRASILGQNTQILEDIEKLFFATIPLDNKLQEGGEALFDFFNFLKIQLQQGTLDFKKSLNFETLLDLFREGTGASEEILKNLRNIPTETQLSINEFFNSYKSRVSELSTILQQSGLLDTLFGGGDQQNAVFQALLKIEEKQSQLFEQRLELGITENQLLEQSRAIILEELGLADKLKTIEQQKKTLTQQITTEKLKGEKADQELISANETQLGLLDEQAASYKTLVETILTGVQRNNQFVRSLEEGEKVFQRQNTIINKNKKDLDQTFDPQKLEQYFSTLGKDLEVVLSSLVLELDFYLQRFGEDGTKAIMRGVVEGLKQQGDLTRQEVERTIDLLERASIAIKVAFGGTGQLFTEQIEYLRKLLNGLPNELTPLQEGFQNIADIAQKIIGAFLDLSNRLSQIIQANNSLLLEQLAQDEARSLAAIGDANARARELREQEEKKYAKRRFEIEKRARIQELNFATANAIADSAGAIINVFATIPPPASIIYASLLTALTGAQLQVIANQRTSVQAQQFVGRRGGLVSGGSHEQGGVPALLEGGEFIVNREAVSRFGDQISDLNSSTGGRRLAIDDSRIVQAISSQNMTSSPLKAYVLYNDIQSTEKLNKKITQLAKL